MQGLGQEARSKLGHALETAVLLELLRQGLRWAVRARVMASRWIHSRFPEGRRELPALENALQQPIGAGASAHVMSLDRCHPVDQWPEAVTRSSALEWPAGVNPAEGRTAHPQ